MTNDKDGAALLPCPFCGAEAPRVFPANTFVECQGCGGLGPDGANETEAIAAWNRRTALPPVKQSVGEGLINQSRKVRNYSDPNDVFEAVPTRFIVEAGERALSHDQRGGSGE